MPALHRVNAGSSSVHFGVQSRLAASLSQLRGLVALRHFNSELLSHGPPRVLSGGLVGEGGEQGARCLLAPLPRGGGGQGCANANAFRIYELLVFVFVLFFFSLFCFLLQQSVIEQVSWDN